MGVRAVVEEVINQLDYVEQIDDTHFKICGKPVEIEFDIPDEITSDDFTVMYLLVSTIAEWIFYEKPLEDISVKVSADSYGNVDVVINCAGEFRLHVNDEAEPRIKIAVSGDNTEKTRRLCRIGQQLITYAFLISKRIIEKRKENLTHER